MRNKKNDNQNKEWHVFSKNKAILLTVVLFLVISFFAVFIFPLNGQDSIKIGKTNYDFYWISKSIKLGLDVEGGMYAVYEADLSEFKTEDDRDSAVKGTISNLESLLFNEGYTEATVTKQGTNQIRVEVPSVEDTEHLISLLGEPAVLEFKDEDGNVLIKGGEHLERATALLYEGSYVISLKFNQTGKELFAKGTEANVGKTISIVINGEEVMAPTVNAVISEGNAIISGNYTYQTANDMATKINAGTFAVKLSPISTASISPTLGQDALKYSIIAGVVGLVLIMIFLLVVYKGMGIAASFALLTYSILLIYFLALVPWVQLTLPSIAGIILSVGMAVDANVIVFERVKEEKRTGGIGKGIPSSIQNGFSKGLPAIVDGNVTTILGTIVMIIFGATAIKSFGITLLIGVLLSMFSALIITRLFLNIILSFNNDNERFFGLTFKEKRDEKA